MSTTFVIRLSLTPWPWGLPIVDPLLPKRYEKLLNDLEHAGLGDEAGDVLEAGIYAINACVNFIDADPAHADEKSRVIMKILHALHDISKGSAPPLLKSRLTASKGGRPTNLSEHALRAPVIHALNILIKSGVVSPEGAGNIMERELQRGGVRHSSGQQITAKQVLRWRAELGARSPEITNDIYKIMTAGLKPTTPPETENAAIRLVRGVVKRLKQSGF